QPSSSRYELPKIARELLFERCHHNRTPIAKADIESHASDPDFFVGFGSEAAESWRVKGVIFVIKAEIEHIGREANIRCELVFRTESGRPPPAGIVRRKPLGHQWEYQVDRVAGFSPCDAAHNKQEQLIDHDASARADGAEVIDAGSKTVVTGKR